MNEISWMRNAVSSDNNYNLHKCIKLFG